MKSEVQVTPEEQRETFDEEEDNLIQSNKKVKMGGGDSMQGRKDVKRGEDQIVERRKTSFRENNREK